MIIIHYNLNLDENILSKKDCFYIEHFSVSHSCMPRTVPHMLLVYAAHSSGFHYIDKVSYDVCEGDIFIIKPNIETDFYSSVAIDLSIYCCAFALNILPFKLEEIVKDFPELSDFFCGNRKFIRVRDTKNNNIRNLMVGMLDDSLYIHPCTKYTLTALLTLTLINIFKIYSVVQISEIMLNSNMLVNMMMRYVQRHIYSKVTLSQMAKEFHVTPQHLCRVFKKETGDNFTNFANRMRVEKIKDALEYTDRPLHLIYSDYDFTTKYLNKLFFEETGYSISEYKKKFNYKVNNPLYKTERKKMNRSLK